jgi:PKD repeat protein
MCYADGGPKNVLTYPCNTLNSSTNPAWDCGEDDYFNPTPPFGSYLATHWNIQNSSFMCSIARCQTFDNPPHVTLSTSAYAPGAPVGPHGHSGSPMTLTAATASDDAIVDYSWTLNGDRRFTTSTGTTPSIAVTPVNNEAYIPIYVGVAVTDSDGVVSTATIPVYPALTAYAAVAAGTYSYGTPIKFFNNSSDPDGEPLHYAWEFTSNGTIDSTAFEPSAVYTVPGTYKVTLTVSESSGARSAYSFNVTELSPAPTLPPTSASSAPTPPQVTAFAPILPGVMLRSAAELGNRCRVPRLIGKTLVSAKKALRLAHCSLGKVRAHSKHGLVLAQQPRAGTILASGGRVSITIGRKSRAGRRRR